jgi:hypothetical protein
MAEKDRPVAIAVAVIAAIATIVAAYISSSRRDNSTPNPTSHYDSAGQGAADQAKPTGHLQNSPNQLGAQVNAPIGTGSLTHSQNPTNQEKPLSSSAAVLSSPSMSTSTARTNVDRTSARIGDFFFTIHDCKRTGQQIECSGFATNKAQRSKNLFVWVFNRTYFVDNLGNKSDDVSGLVGGGGTEKLGKMVPEARDLAPEIPVTFSLSVQGLPASGTFVSIFLVTSQGSGVLSSFPVSEK